MINPLSIIGILLAMFLPGFFITLIFFREIKMFERILLSIAFSIMLSVALGISLGYNENVKNITGGITKANVWKWELMITAVLGLLALVVHRKAVSFAKIKTDLEKSRHSIKKASKKLKKEKEIVQYRKL